MSDEQYQIEELYSGAMLWFRDKYHIFHLITDVDVFDYENGRVYVDTACDYNEWLVNPLSISGQNTRILRVRKCRICRECRKIAENLEKAARLAIKSTNS